MQRQFKFTKKDFEKIQKFVNDIDKDIKIKKGRCFECVVPDKKVFISHKKYDYESEIFTKFLEQNDNIKINFVLIALLHEIGHIKTYNKKLEQQRTILYSIYNCLNRLKIISVDKLNQKYFMIPDERQATLWGLEYYKNNKNKCDKLVQELGIM